MTFSRRETMAAMAAGTAAMAAARPARAVPAPHAPLALWYHQPATEWTQALPIGNGRLGAMVFGGISQERLQLNESTLWAGQPYDPVNPQALTMLPKVRELIFAGKIAEAEALANQTLMARPLTQMPYQTLGDLILDFPGLGDASAYRRDLDLDKAMATTRFEANDGVTHVRQVIASPADQIIAVRLTAGGENGLDVDITLRSPQREVQVVADGPAGLLLTGRNGASKGVEGNLRFAARLAAEVEGGTTTTQADDGRLNIRNAKAITLYIAMATSYRRFDDVGGDPIAATAATIARVRGRTFARIAADTAAAHQRLFRRVALDLGTTAAAQLPTDQRIAASQTSDDPALAALYFHFARYLMICASRPGGQPANLQGLWNDSLNPPWGSKYTININTQMNYWPAEPTALGECVAPLVDMVRELAITGERTARTMYGARGWVAHHNTDLWRATAPIDGAQFGLWPTGGAWLCTHLWDHYDYGRDHAYLMSIYPLMAGAARFFLDTLQRDPSTGFLVTNPSMSPENPHGHGGTLCAGPTMDMAILRDLFTQTIEAATILQADVALVGEMRAARDALAPYKIGRNGQLQEWQQDWDADAPEQDHRHVSHLYGLHPSRQIMPDDTPTLAAAARRTLEIRGDRATGWATAWRINLWARLKDGDHAHDILRFLLGPERTYPNMFDAHPPFQIDGNFGGAAGIVEMLMGSHGDVIDLLPALPKAWPTGSVTGLRARGRCRIDLHWRDGRLDRAVLRPELSGTRTIRLADKRRVLTLKTGMPVSLTPKDFA
ncbi:glycoside hydrolase family 95 protein [Sphingobium limneticum]|uniref:Glycoside hydrolase family 95 protein n=1 Tax=Sphingobium limneticum TaxID=1007511 RepID=A0A5J5HU87_9SPHN|nr:glycoside hydrolase family 95 protein [Sphingobium limneticum]KAA9012631.1 glycoside hydrolase family 95 protein [Sphingobium limneticum]KAA9024977.1 glycoside hydrolase family 95 protein [Sphingobium limneticum]